MNFATIEFGVFFAAVLVVYYIINHRRQNRFLLLASYVFYGWWDWRFCGLLLLSSLVDYLCALRVDRTRRPDLSPARRKLILTVSVVTNLAILGFFKYFDFFAESLARLALAGGIELSLPTLRIILPVGISFYTFQSMSYTIDVYRGELRATENLFDLMLYVSLFTQLVAGPIERGAHLMPQILKPRRVTPEGFSSGAQLAFVGLFKKMVIADNMAVLVNSVFRTADPSGAEVLLGTYAFALQIYCDFSGYTDIARGTARMLGFDISLNFRLPFLAANPNDFWQRWHISLSSWLRDYLYIPLGGNRESRLKTLRNLLITMFLGGLWHGASGHFVAWGIYHGLLLIIYRIWTTPRKARRLTFEIRNGIKFWLSVLFFFHLTCFGWLIFRVSDLGQAGEMLSAIFTNNFWEPVCGPLLLIVGAFGIPLAFFQIYQYYRRELEPWISWPWWIRAGFYLVLFYGLVIFGAPGTYDFIYFQF
ncbi:MAG: MBOAT family O-acyltransferase [Candidatus Auribacterota bacterium]|nr:MBOAT family O-acyltransferase [Candidatus Auribacterota bacterium]